MSWIGAILLSPLTLALYLVFALLLAIVLDLALARVELPLGQLKPSAERLNVEHQALAATYSADWYFFDPKPHLTAAQVRLNAIELRLIAIDRDIRISLLARLARHWRDFLTRLLPVLEVFTIRLLNLAAIVPILFIACLVACIDGIVRREVRKAGAGLESARIYHFAKRLIKPWVIWTSISYLAVPLVIEPLWLYAAWIFVLPVLVSIVTSRFKKYV